MVGITALRAGMLDLAGVVAGGRSAWYLGVQLLAVYSIFAVTLYLLPG